MKPCIRSTVMGIALGVTAAGCTSTPVKFDTVTDLSKVDVTRGRKITSEAGGMQLFTVIPLNINDRQQRAYQELLEKAGNDAIADLKVSETWTWAYVGTLYWTVLEATAYPRK